MLAYASPADAIDDTYGMSEFICLDNLAELCPTIVQIYKYEYCCELNQADLDCSFSKLKIVAFGHDRVISLYALAVEKRFYQMTRRI